MEFIPTAIPGCLEIRPRPRPDDRGVFVKIFHAPSFRAQGLEADFQEDFYSLSKKGVLRGLHFHLPPHDHAKLVTCVAGAALDAVVDLRQGSPTFGRHILVELGAESRRLLYIPRGLAHGFYALKDETLMLYKTTKPYSPDHDGGIRWDSASIPWPDRSPIVSPRDQGLPTLPQFKSPFSWTVQP